MSGSRPWPVRLPVLLILSFISQWSSMIPAYANKIVVWGQFRGTNVPSGLENSTAIVAGNYFGVALRPNGQIAAWGDLWDGQRPMVDAVSNAQAIAAGYSQ